MALLRAIVLAAVLAGSAGGLLASLLHEVGAVPLIQAAEVLEQSAPATHGHDHGLADWAPADGLERTAFTVLANLLTGIAFALLLVAGYAMRGTSIGWREGLFWGLGGFAAFALAPFLGLPPELPGAAAAPLGERQLWWLATAVATAAGLILLAFRATPLSAACAVTLIAVPHLIGAPAPAEGHALVPEALTRRFAATVTVSSFLVWSLLGTLSAVLFQRLSPIRTSPSPAASTLGTLLP